MNKNLSKLIMLVGATIASTGIVAQPSANDSILRRDFSFVAGNDPWLGGDNAAALTRYKSKNISMAEVYGLYQKGGFVNYNESPRLTEFGARVESFYRISPAIVAYGKMSYGNFAGHDMTGSAFIHPERKPFDIVEDSLTNQGKKHRDTYDLTGAIGWNFWKRASIGARIDFTAANMEKYKDLRHKTKYMNLKASAGVYIPLGSRVSLGADYYYRRNTESLQFSTYARTEQVYVSFINYGPWIGATEQFGNDGFTDKSRELPLLSEYHGMGVQLSIDLLPNLTWYNAFSMAYRKGYYGRKSPYTIIFADHDSHSYSYSTHLKLSLNRQIHSLDFNIASENLVNKMRTYRNATNESGASYYEYFDPVKSGNRLWVNTHVGYTGQLGINGELPTWTVQLGADISHRKQTGYDYPYFRLQKITSTEGYARAERNIDLKKGILSVRLGFSFTKGSGNPFEDGTFIAPSDKQNGFPTMEAFLYREYYFLTAPQYTVDGGLRYSFIFPGTQIKTYADISANNTKANIHNEWLVGRDRTNICLTLGCLF